MLLVGAAHDERVPVPVFPLAENVGKLQSAAKNKFVGFFDHQRAPGIQDVLGSGADVKMLRRRAAAFTEGLQERYQEMPYGLFCTGDFFGREKHQREFAAVLC